MSTFETEPTPVEPTPVEPTPVEPTPVEPTPVEPTPVEPTPEPTESDLSYNFIVDKFTAYPTYNNYKNVIFNMYWRYMASYTDPYNQVYWAERSFVSHINTENIDNFIQFENLTKDDVQKWIDNLPDINMKRLILLEIIKPQIKPPSPPVITLQPPF